MKLKSSLEIHKLSTTNYPIKSWSKKYPDYKVNILDLPINVSYYDFTNTDLFKSHIEIINEYFSYCLEKTKGKVNIFPYPDLVFCGLNTTPLNKIKVVILGQDPYINAELIDDKLIPQAMGLSFSVPKGITVPPSLKNIYRNLIKYEHMVQEPTHGNLAFWAHQGCLMLNTTLTVQHKCSNGHEAKWVDISDALIEFISKETENVVFMLWGSYSLKKRHLIDESRHKIIISSHPSPYSFHAKLGQYNSFENTDHFGEANKYLAEKGKSTILWQFI